VKRGLTLAWAVAIGVITYRSVKECHRPPMPGTLLSSSGLFVLLALLAEPAPELATTLGWGFVTAAFLNLGNVAGGGCGGTSGVLKPGRTEGNTGAASPGNAGPGRSRAT